jgi:hypothetical protein
MRLEIYAHRQQVDVQVLHVAAQNTGLAGLANKGGIVAEVLVNSRTKLSFITTHLEAHEGQAKYQVRCNTIADILEGTKKHRRRPDVSCTSHYSFWMGDLNFRSELPNSDTLSDSDHKQQVMTMVSNKDWEMLNTIDELGRAIHTNKCLAGYQTLFCNFPPTFKVERDFGYQYNEKRRPSYTDRILWKPGHQLENMICPLIYEPIDDFTSSDHKPIRCAFNVEMNEPYSLRPKLLRSRRNLFTSTRSFICTSTDSRSRLRKESRGRGVDRHDADTDGMIPSKDHLNLFISEIQCNISWENKHVSNSLPDPYICFVSDPEEIVKLKSTKQRSKLRNKLALALRLKSRLKSMTVTDDGWPCTSTKKQSFSPDWEDEEIKVEIRTHGSNGLPIEISGAMLHICVIDHRADGDVLLGSFSFNLIHIIRKCCRTTLTDPSRLRLRSNRHANSSGKLGSSNSLGAANNPSSDIHNSDPIHKTTNQRSSVNHLMNHFNNYSQLKQPHERTGARSSPKEALTDDNPIFGVDVNESLVLNGVVTGRIQCRIEAWWMDEKPMKVLKEFGDFAIRSGKDDTHTKETQQKSMAHQIVTDDSTTTNHHQDNGTMLNGTLFSKTTDGHQIMLKQRPVPKTRHD